MALPWLIGTTIAGLAGITKAIFEEGEQETVLPSNKDEWVRCVGRNVELYRRNKGLTKAQLATNAEVSRTVLLKLESGQGDPRLSTLWALAKALDVPLTTLMAPMAVVQLHQNPNASDNTNDKDGGPRETPLE